MATTIQFKRGAQSGLPTLAAGEPAFTTDTFRLYIGTSGSGNKQIGGAINLDDVTDVTIVSVGANDVLYYNGSAWVNATISEILGYTPTDTASLGVLAVLDEVDTAQIAVESVTATRIAPGAVEASRIADGAVTLAKIGARSGGSLLLGSTPTSDNTQEISVGPGLFITGASLNIDADLQAIAALSGTDMIYYRSAANTWTAVTIGTGLTFSGGNLSVTATTYQPVDAELTAIAGLTSAADRGIYFTGSGTAALFTLTTFGRSLVDDTDASAARATLGLVIGTDVQAFDAALTALAGGSDFVQFTGPATSTKVFTLPNATCTILTTNAAVTVAQGGTGATDASTARTNLGVAIGSDVQAYDSDLAAVAGLSSTGIIARTGSGTASVRTITAPAAGITVSNGDGASGNPTLALANDLSALEGLSSTGIAVRTTTDAWAQRSIAAGSLIGVTNGDGVSGNPTVAVNINGATGNTSPVDADELPHYQVSSTTNKKVTVGNLRKLITPPGTITQYGGSSSPSGWLECDGSAVSRTTYADLYSAVGTAFGSGDGSTTFNLPDFRRRAAVGKGGTGTGTLANSIGSTGGAETHTLSSGEMPAHTHGPDSGFSTFWQRNNGGGQAANVTTGVGTLDALRSVTGSTGGGGSHNNLQPSLVVMFLIKT